MRTSKSKLSKRIYVLAQNSKHKCWEGQLKSCYMSLTCHFCFFQCLQILSFRLFQNLIDNSPLNPFLMSLFLQLNAIAYTVLCLSSCQTEKPTAMCRPTLHFFLLFFCFFLPSIGIIILSHSDFIPQTQVLIPLEDFVILDFFKF